VIAEPDDTAALRAAVASDLVGGLLLTDIPESQLLVARSGAQHVAVGAPGKRLDHVVVLEGQPGLAILQVPQLDSVVARRGREDVLGGRVEQHVTNLPTRSKPLCTAHVLVQRSKPTFRDH
jgi:hypothetical protein